MTESMLGIILASLPPTIASLSALAVGLFNGMASRKNRVIAKQATAELKQTSDNVDKKTDELKQASVTANEKTDQIHTLVDGNLSKVQARLDLALGRIDGLEKHVQHLVQQPVEKEKSNEHAERPSMGRKEQKHNKPGGSPS